MVFVGKPEGKRQLGRPRPRWADIRMDIEKLGCSYMDWNGLARYIDGWRRLVSAVMKIQVP